MEIQPSFKLGGDNQAEAQVVVAIVRVVVVTVRRTAILRIVVPAATTVHTIRPPLVITQIQLISSSFALNLNYWHGW